MRWLALPLIFTLSACWSDPDPETTGSINQCAAKLFSNFSPRDHEQCMEVCRKCGNGTPVTCAMSCKLKGA